MAEQEAEAIAAEAAAKREEMVRIDLQSTYSFCAHVHEIST